MDYKILIVIAISFTVGCCINSEPGCGEPDPYYTNDIVISLKNSSNDVDLVNSGTSGGFFDPTLSKVYLDGELDPTDHWPSFYIDDWVMPPNIRFDSTYVLNYLLELITYKGEVDTDTLVFKYTPHRGECNEELSNIELLYNNELHYSGHNVFFLTVRIDKY